MKKMLQRALHRQEGQGLLLVIIITALLGLILIPSLKLMFTGIKASSIYSDAMLDRYSSDSAVEHALGRLKYESGFADSINETSPSLSYELGINNRLANVAVQWVDHTMGEPPEGNPQAWRIEISKVANPSSGLPGQELTITYTITVMNVGTSTIYLTEVGDRLPSSFQAAQYVSGSSTGISSINPETSWANGRLQLVWPLGTTPGYRMNAGTVHQQQFQVLVTIGWETHLNLAWVIASPSSIGYVSTGDTAPVEGARLFDVIATSGRAVVQARLGLAEDNSVKIISWTNSNVQ
jgi:uncharacterized repeat protein (TIGR01451 family)